jgi:hypothetical protein
MNPIDLQKALRFREDQKNPVFWPFSTASLAIMKHWFTYARTAGILYLQFAAFATAVLWLWLSGDSFQTHRELLPTIPGAVQLFGVIVALTVSSLSLGIWLIFRSTVNPAQLITAVVISLTAVWWNVLAAVTCSP